MFNKNSMLAGIFIALLFPAIALAAGYWLKDTVELMNKPSLPYFAAIALNLILLRFAYKKSLDQTVRGIILATFVFMLLVFLFKIHPMR